MREQKQFRDVSYQPALYLTEHSTGHHPVSGMMASAAVQVMGKPQFGIQTSAACRFEDRFLSQEDSVAFFDLVFHAGVDEQSMQNLVTFIRAL